jgi:hypothetical protein
MLLVAGSESMLSMGSILRDSINRLTQEDILMRTISAAIILTAALAATDAEADPRVLSLCLTTGGSLINGLQILPSDLDERKNRLGSNGQRFAWNCQADQTEVLVEIVGVFPRTNKAIQMGLIPRPQPIEVKGNAIDRGVFLRSFPAHAEPGEAAPRIYLEVDDEGQPETCTMWFLIPGEYTADSLAFYNLNGSRNFFGWNDRRPPLDQIGVDGHVAQIVPAVPVGDVRESPVPVRFEMPSGKLFTFDNARVSFIDGPDPAACEGSATVSVTQR